MPAPTPAFDLHPDTGNLPNETQQTQVLTALGLSEFGIQFVRATDAAQANLLLNPPPAEAIRFVSIKPDTIGFSASLSTSGYFAVRDYTGALTYVYAGDGFTHEVPLSGPYAGDAPKEFYAWPCVDNGNPTYTEDWMFTYLEFFEQGIVSMTNLPTYILNYLSISGNPIETFSIVNSYDLQHLFCDGCTNLQSLEVTGSPAMRTMSAPGCSSLSSVIMTGSSVEGFASYHTTITGQLDVASCNLDGPALDALYASLEPNTSGQNSILNVSGNPGTASDDPSIATAKNYTVVGT